MENNRKNVVIIEGENLDIVNSLISDRIYMLFEITQVKQELNINDLHTNQLYDYAKNFEIFAVRRKGSCEEYNRCRYFLKLLSGEYGSMSDRDIPPEYFKSKEKILEYTLSFPRENELMDFLKDKELILLMDYNKSTD